MKNNLQSIEGFVFRFKIKIVTCWARLRFYHFFSRVGKKVVFVSPPNFSPDFRAPLFLDIGDSCEFYENVSFRGRGNLRIGNHCSINSGVIFGLTCDMTIGNHVMIADNVSFRTADHEFKDTSIPMLQQGEVSASVTVEDDVWIGANAVILRGVRLGKGSIIGANAVVTKDIEPYTIAAGVPAKEIKKRTP